MRATRFLFGKIWQYDKRMIGMIVLFSVLSAVYPFIWVYVPTAIIRLAGQATIAVGRCAKRALSFARGRHRVGHRVHLGARLPPRQLPYAHE